MICETNNKKILKSFQGLEDKFNLKFNFKFDYSKSIFTGIKNNIEIICPEHGSFLQSPKVHLLSQYGCKKCYFNSKIKEQDEFIKKASELHKNKFDYSKVKYKDNKTYVEIICPEHGSFQQLPKNHLKSEHGLMLVIQN